MTEKLKLLITDDNDQVRHGLNLLLSKNLDFEVVGMATNGRLAIEACKTKLPDVVLMDVGMPVMDGIEACQQLKERCPSVKVIMLTSHDNEEDLLAALAAGACGYCLKDADLERLVTAIRAVGKGDLWIDSQIAHSIKRLVVSSTPKSYVQPNQVVYQPLSPREIEVLNLVVEGLSNADIGEKLNISLDTVKTHVRHIMDKLSVNDRTQMAVKALRSGLL